VNLLRRSIKNHTHDDSISFKSIDRFNVDPEIIRAGLINILENAMEAWIEDKRDIIHWIRFTSSVDEANGVFEILAPDLKSNPPSPPARHDI
jgi:hypothetical protein